MNSLVKKILPIGFYKKPLLFIPINSTVIGTVNTVFLAHIEGFIKGDINTNNACVIASTGKVIGNITATKVEVNGAIVGNIYCTDGTVFVNEGALIEGHIYSKELHIKDTAVINTPTEQEGNNNNKTAKDIFVIEEIINPVTAKATKNTWF